MGTCSDPIGDVTGSASVDVVDVQCLILSALQELEDSSLDEPPICVNGSLSVADLNCDGVPSVTDVVLGVQLALGQPLSPLIDSDGSGLPRWCEVQGMRLRAVSGLPGKLWGIGGR